MLLLQGSTGLNPRELFANGEQGLWLDPSDFSTMWQDSGKTTPVTAAGDPVGYIADKSGRGNDARQTTSGQRPTLQTSGGLWYLSFDGSDDSLVTNSVDMTGTAQMTVIAGVRSLANTDQIIVEASANYNSNIGTFILGRANPSLFSSGLNGNGQGINYGTVAGAAPRTDVISQLLDNSATTNAGENSLRINAADQSLAYVLATPNANAGNFGNYQLFIGRRNQASLPFNGQLYQLIIRGKTTPTGKLLEAERFVGKKTGVSF